MTRNLPNFHLAKIISLNILGKGATNSGAQKSAENRNLKATDSLTLK